MALQKARALGFVYRVTIGFAQSIYLYTHFEAPRPVRGSECRSAASGGRHQRPERVVPWSKVPAGPASLCSHSFSVSLTAGGEKTTTLPSRLMFTG